MTSTFLSLSMTASLYSYRIRQHCPVIDITITRDLPGIVAVLFNDLRKIVIYGIEFQLMLTTPGDCFFPGFTGCILRHAAATEDQSTENQTWNDPIARVLHTTPNYLLGFADNNDEFTNEAIELFRGVKDQAVREILLKQIVALL